MSDLIATTPDEVESGERREREIREKELEDARVVLSTEQGRRFLWRYLERTTVFRTTFNPNSASQSAFNEGRRAVGLQLLADVTDSRPDAYVQMAQEAAVAKAKEETKEKYEREQHGDAERNYNPLDDAF